MKKIIVISYNYEPEHIPRVPDPDNRFFVYGFGGAMARSLKKYITDHQVEAWRLDGYTKNYYAKEINDIKFKVFPSFHIDKFTDISFRFLKELRREVAKTNPILVVIHTHSWLTYQTALFFGSSPIITTHHGEWSPIYRYSNTKGLRKLKSMFEMVVEKFVMKNIDCVYLSDMNEVHYLRKVFKDMNYLLWSTGIDLTYMYPIPKDEARRMLGWDIKKKYIFYVGKLYKYKQVDELIRIWLEIKKERPDVELVIAGNSFDDPWEEFTDLAVNSGAIVLGRILNRDLYRYYSAADVYVLITLRDDYFGGIGIAALESLACNTPVVNYALRNYIGDNLSDLGEAPNTIEGYKQAIVKVLDNPQRYKNMRESVNKYYSMEAILMREKKVFDELNEKYNKVNPAEKTRKGS